MSLKLDEKDVRAVASRRYWNRLTWRVMVYSFLLLVLSIGLAVWLSEPWIYFALVPILVVVVWMIWLGIRVKKAEEDLVSEWKNELGGK